MKMLPRFAGVALLSLASTVVLPAATNSSERQGAVPAGLVYFVRPEFPEWAKVNSVCRGAATVAVSWDARGLPTDVVTVETSSPEFGAAACEAVRQWRADPALRAERFYEFQFALSGVVICHQKGANTLATEAKADFKRRVLTREDLDAAPKLLVQPMPQPADVAGGRIESGRVVVDFFVDEDGRVRAPSIVEATAPELVEPTLLKMREWRFETPRRNGRPVLFAESWAIEFKRAS
ncbi:MAG: energy transducer TonB [Opitutae bacterium]|nr:energy transducer TonB [Opitutae bacterium]